MSADTEAVLELHHHSLGSAHSRTVEIRETQTTRRQRQRQRLGRLSYEPASLALRQFRGELLKTYIKGEMSLNADGGSQTTPNFERSSAKSPTEECMKRQRLGTSRANH
jgi:hypothetical protein